MNLEEIEFTPNELAGIANKMEDCFTQLLREWAEVRKLNLTDVELLTVYTNSMQYAEQVKSDEMRSTSYLL